ncbi:MAG: ferrous iron transport protein A [Candidatus Omnitrophica bacterium]|nr:ferrous iron transport protein A [Candidatus Omnitrophota bacterium]
MPLSMLGLRNKGVVVGLRGKFDLKIFLAELGFVSGKEVEIMQYTSGNNLIVGLGGCRLALDRSLAHLIEIIPQKEL